MIGDIKMEQLGLTTEILRDLYCTQKLSINEIARIYDVDSGSVSRWLHARKVSIRPFNESCRLGKHKAGLKFSDQKLIEFYNRGLTDSAIARKLNVDQSLVSYRRRALNLPIRLEAIHRSMQKFSDAELLRCYNENWSIHKMAKHFKVSESTVHNRLKRLNLKSRFKPHTRSYTKEQFLKYYQLDLSDSIIGRILDVSSTSVRKFRIKLSLPTNYVVKNWKDSNLFYSELRKVIAKLGHFPTDTELLNLGYLSLRMAFKYYGGMEKVRTQLGFTELRKHGFGYIINLPNGITVKSRLEANVANWLIAKDIPFVYGFKIGKFESDFKVGKYFIEIWGLKKKDYYRQRMQKKILFYRSNNLNLIELLPPDIPCNLDCKLACLIRYSRSQRTITSYAKVAGAIV